tara:strand:- start:211 stop:1473 length:1263 start_codon:yes stop_codon:yes gene_type:complete
MKKVRTFRLLRKASIDFLLMSAGLLILTAIALFVYTRTLLDEEIAEELYSQIAFIQQDIDAGNSPSSLKPIIEINEVSRALPETVKDTLMFDPRQNELELFRELSKTIQSENRWFQIKVRVLFIESEDIIFGIIFSFTSIFIIAFLILFFINRSRNEKLWHPFFNSLDKLKDFSFDAKEPMVFEASNIEEFNELNGRLNTLVLKINSDYSTLKQFTEDVSHEAQTPLAIMQAKIENIINQQHISDSLYEELTSLQKDIKRLTQLNKRLVLLAKIDNNQFSKAEKVDLATVICERIEDFQDISEHTFKKEVSPNSNVIIDSYLAEILTNNLLSNAVKYSDPKSMVFVRVSEHMLEVSNKGTTAIENPERIFERFYRESSNKKSTGLGLSIVSKICSYYDFDASYSFRESEQLHVFRITFIK